MCAICIVYNIIIAIYIKTFSESINACVGTYVPMCGKRLSKINIILLLLYHHYNKIIVDLRLRLNMHTTRFAYLNVSFRDYMYIYKLYLIYLQCVCFCVRVYNLSVDHLIYRRHVLRRIQLCQKYYVLYNIII